MRYYEVWVRSARYRGASALTYSHDMALQVGSIVRVELQSELVTAVIVRETTKPKIRATIKPVHTVLDLPHIPPELLSTCHWLKEYYQASVGSLGQLLIPASIPQKLPQATFPSSSDQQKPLALPTMTEEQTKAVQAITQNTDSYIIHGRTGSGKTRVYLEVACAQLSQGKSVVVLSPEIGLTSQLAEQCRRVAGTEKVVVLHSQMTSAERLAAWRQIGDTTTPLIVVGPRSALFAPLRNLGLVIVDEFHEPAYKQEQTPRYHANRVASVLAKCHDATLIFGSATPPVHDYYLAQERGKKILRLTRLAQDTPTHTEQIVVDLKNRDEFNRSAFLADVLVRSIQESMSKGEQSMLYLNRRGTARVSLCQHCGWQALCPNCDLPLTYHGDIHRLQCHVCGFGQAVPTNCPTCGHSELTFKSIGTKAVMSELERLFPDAKIMRFDSDNTKSEQLVHHYEAISRGEIDIVVGTQTLAKGLDLPLLSTLGVVVADTSLYLPDYTAAERTYQLVNQVLGRVTRGHRDAKAIIQTYDPDNVVLKSALIDDWQTFYATELAERRKYDYPPFCQTAKVSCRRASPKAAATALQKIHDLLLQAAPDMTIDGPAPSLHEKFGNTYEWQLVLKSRSRTILQEATATLPKGNWTLDLDPSTLL